MGDRMEARALEEVYLVKTKVNYEELKSEVGTKYRCDRRRYCDNWRSNDLNYMFRTSVHIDWDRRRSISIDQCYLNASRYIDGGDVNFCSWETSSRASVEEIISITKERSTNTIGKKKCVGISKMKRAWKFKYCFVVDHKKVLEDVIEEKCRFIEAKRRIEETAAEAKCISDRRDHQSSGKSNLDNEEEDGPPCVMDGVGDGAELDGETSGSESSVSAGARRAMKRRELVVARSKGLNSGRRKGNINRRRKKRSNMNTFRLRDGGAVGKENDHRLRSDTEWMMEALRSCKYFMGHMRDKWIEVPHLRCIHMKESNRRLVSVCSARVRRGNVADKRDQHVTIGLIIEVLSREVICLNVIHSVKTASSGDATARAEVVTCSCDVKRENGTLSNSNCWHSAMLRDDKEIMRKIRSKLVEGYVEDTADSEDNPSFGAWIEVGRECITVGNEEEDSIICTQMDQVDGETLTKRGQNIAKRWSCWNVYDVYDANFVCCIRSALGSGIMVTKMKCTQCRFGSERKCRHEAACTKILAEAGTVMLTENGEMEEVNVDGDTESGESEVNGSDSEYGESELGSLADSVEGNESSEPYVSGALKGRNGAQQRCRYGEKCVEQPKSYFACEKMRALYMCKGERRITKQLSDLIENWDRSKGGLSFADADGLRCEGIIMDGSGHAQACKAKKGPDVELILRKVTLHTLNHDILSVVLKDWLCPACGFENRYNGELHGIYPAARHRAFTVELMYFWMHESMTNGMSFRSIFQLTYNLHHTDSYRRKFDTGRLDVLSAEYKRDRRLANEALRVFCGHIDVADNSEPTKQLFSCSECEVPLSEDDCEQLGIKKEHRHGGKRFGSIVMDGKVIGALRDFPIDNGNIHRLVGTKGLPAKVLNNRVTRNALKSLTKGLRRCIRAVQYGRGVEIKHNLTVKNGTVYFRLGSLLELKGVTKANYHKIMTTARWYCDRRSCLCKVAVWTEDLDHDLCAGDRLSMERKNGCYAASKVISALLCVGDDGADGDAVELTRTGDVRRNLQTDHGGSRSHPSALPSGEFENPQSSGEDTSDESSKELERNSGSQRVKPSGKVDTKNQWVKFRCNDWTSCTEVMELVLENTQFMLGEPLTLGFYPYYPECLGCCQDDTESDSPPSKRRAGRQLDEHLIPDSSDREWHSSIWDDWSANYFGLLLSNGTEGCHNFQREWRTRYKMMKLLSAESEEAHVSVSTHLLEFSNCTHDGSNETLFPCEKCGKQLETCGTAMNRQSTILSVFLTEVIRSGRKAPVLARLACYVVHYLIDTKLSAFKVYRKEVAKKIDETVVKYWKQFGHFGKNVPPHHDDDDEMSLFVFPGRQLFREPIMTDSKDKSDCKKKYFSSRQNMTSFISLQCSCRHPKIIGFCLIKQVESIAMAISTVLAYLRFPPRILWYDNACNLYDSAILRTPFLLRFCFPVVDRFHFHGHSCSNYFNPDRYKQLAQERSVAAEVMNSVLDRSAGYIRYLKGSNIKPYITIMFALHNFSSMMKDKLNRKELPLIEMGKFYNKQFQCRCAMCTILNDKETWQYATVQSVSFETIHKEVVTPIHERAR